MRHVLLCSASHSYLEWKMCGMPRLHQYVSHHKGKELLLRVPRCNPGACYARASLCPLLYKCVAVGSMWRQVAQLYLSRPLLWKGRKFDIRIVALLVSSNPLELYVHNCYWPRVAERPHETERAASLEDPRVSLTATHLVRETAAGEACHPHYEVSRHLCTVCGWGGSVSVELRDGLRALKFAFLQRLVER